MDESPEVMALGVANRVRGIVISSFAHIEYVMIDTTIVASYNGSYASYYENGFVPTKIIVKRFLACFNTIAPVLKLFISSEENFKSDIDYLVRIRNIAAHYLFEPEWTVSNAGLFVFSGSLDGSRDCHILTKRDVSLYQRDCESFVKFLRRIQLATYRHLEKDFQEIEEHQDLRLCKSLDYDFKFSSKK